MTAPLNLAALKALHEAATGHEYKRNDRITTHDREFLNAAHTHWLELLAMADTYHRLCAHVRIAACGPNHSMGDRFAEVDALKERAEKAEAEKAAMAERLEIAETVVARHVTQRCRCKGKGSYTPTCFRCDDSGDDHECPDDRQCVDVECAKAREVIAAHEAERGKE